MKRCLIIGNYDWNCGNCPDIQNHPFKCAKCNNSPFCNTVEFYNNALFCWNKTEEMSIPISDLRNCETQCFVARDENGKGLKLNSIMKNLTLGLHPEPLKTPQTTTSNLRENSQGEIE